MSIKYVVAVSGADSDDPIKSDNNRENLTRVAQVLRSVASGHKPVVYSVDIHAAATAASATVTCAAAAAADTVTVNGVVFTAVAGAAGANQFSIDGDNTADAAALAASINASVTAGIKDVVVATSSGAVVTVSAQIPGLAGNAIQIKSSTGVRLAVGGTATRDSDTYLSGGAGTKHSLSF